MLPGIIGFLFVAGPFFPGVFPAGGGGTTSFGESGQVVVLAVGAGVSAVGVTRGIEIVGGSMAGDGAAGIVSVCGSVLFFISTDTFFSNAVIRSSKLSNACEPRRRHRRRSPISALMRGDELLLASEKEWWRESKSASK